ncbi:MAG: hypothetical protein GXO42_00370 [bacterium]|nr:hypothetical protein [bacterium]
MKMYCILELRATTEDKLKELLEQRKQDLEQRYKDKIKLLGSGEPKKEQVWYISFLEAEYFPRDLADLVMFVAAESPAYLELDGEDLECSAEELSRILTAVAASYYKLKKFLNLSTLAYTEQGNSRWITPELAEDLCLTDKEVKLVELGCEVHVAEPSEEYIKPLFTVLDDFLPCGYSVDRSAADGPGYVLAVRVQGICRKISTLFYLIITYCPVFLQIHRPDYLKIPLSELQEGLNSLASMLATAKAMLELRLQTKFRQRGQVQ